MHRVTWIFVAAAITVAVTIGMATGQLPLGIHGEWEWGRIEPLIIWPGVVVAGFAFATVVALLCRPLMASAHGRVAGVLGLVVASFMLQMLLQQLGYGLGKWPFVLVSPASSGYYTVARTEVRTAAEFLKDYPTFQARHGPFHVGTHPPGLVLVQYGALKWCEQSPRLVRMLLSIQPASVRDGFAAISAGAVLAPPDQAAIWLVALASQLASALTVVPIYVLARRGAGPMAAWAATALWPLVPAVTIFMPKSDVLYPCLAIGTVAMAVSGRSHAGRVCSSAAAGLLLSFGMFLTLGLLAIVPLIGLAILLHEGVHSRSAWASITTRLLAGSLGFLVPSFAFGMLTGHNLVDTWLACFQKHATFYDLMHRSYWPWIGVNLIEFAVAVGVPTISGAIVGTLCTIVDFHKYYRCRVVPTEPLSTGECPIALAAVTIAWWVTLMLLDLSGKNLGEVARLWMFLMPFALPPTARAIEWSRDRTWLVWTLLSLQVLQTVVFVSAMQGFVDPQSVKIP